MNFTHVELMPVMEHPFYGSWGYQGTGYFAPTSRYGTPQDFKYFVDVMHQNGIGVILDWVPSHFPSDEHALGYFDGTHLFEHADPRKGFHPDWNSLIFNYGRPEVRSFLLSSALYWLDEYHADGLRFDAVASMLYLDYSRTHGVWVPNEHGGRENFVLPLSHDEVVPGKGSLIGKMAGDEWQRFANLRLLFAWMYANPGKKLMFMGGEIGQWHEWNHDASIEWHLLNAPLHAGIARWVEDLNKAYRDIAAFHELDMNPEGFEWIDCCDLENSVVSLIRRGKSEDEMLVAVLNFTPHPRYNYQIGIPHGGHWREVLNSDATLYGGSGQGNMGGLDAAPIPLHGRKWSVTMTLPPLGAVFLRPDAPAPAPAPEPEPGVGAGAQRLRRAPAPGAGAGSGSGSGSGKKRRATTKKKQ